MHPRDECKTAFMTESSCYCYKAMPFGLKNAGATYQRLMDRVLAPMLGRNVQAYVDDMVVNSQQREQDVTNLEELFTTIAKYRLKLNPEKCIFEVEAGKFMDFLLTERGIEANPEKCAAIIAMRSPISVKDDTAHGRSVQVCIRGRRQGSLLFPGPEKEQQVRLDP